MRVSVCAVCLGFALACASRKPPPAPSPPRITDSVPERAAALRAANHLVLENLEVEDERWGVDMAKEREAEARTPAKGTRVVTPKPRIAPDAGTDGLLAK